MVHEDLKPSDILTREAFENAIVANSAIGGSTNAPIHINAIARHIGVELTIEDWEKVGYDVPLLVNMQPAGKYLGEEYYRAGGLPAVMNELLKAKRIHGKALTVNGKTMGENLKGAKILDDDVIRPYKKPLKENAGFKILRGNLFDNAIMKISGVSDEFRKRYLIEPEGPERVRGQGRRVRGPGGLPPPHRRSDAQDRREHDAVHPRHRPDRLSGRGRSREHAAARRADQTRHHSRCPASATAASPALRARRRSSTPRRKRPPAAGSRSSRPATACASTSTRARPTSSSRMARLAQRRADLQKRGGFPIPASQTPWQEIQRGMVEQLGDGMVLKPAVKYQRVAQRSGVPRDNH